MKKSIFILSLILSILCAIIVMVEIASASFICTLDGTCFAQCVEENIPVDSCKLECTVCDWK